MKERYIVLMINVDRLVEIHDASETIRRHKNILEELFYLCLNSSFEETVKEARQQILVWSRNSSITLPTNKEESIELRNEVCHANRDSYNNLLYSVSEKHRYYHPAFTRDYRRMEADGNLLDMFNVLENIIYCNAPILEEDTRNHFGTRPGTMEIAYDEIDGPYIKLSFDLNTTKPEMLKIIDKKFPDISNKLIERFSLPTKRFRDGKALLPYKRIYQLLNRNKNYVTISTLLEKEGLASEEQTPDAVRQRSNSLMQEINRFTHES